MHLLKSCSCANKQKFYSFNSFTLTFKSEIEYMPFMLSWFVCRPMYLLLQYDVSTSMKTSADPAT